MSWHYRVAKNKHGEFKIVEFYTDVEGNAAWTDACEMVADSVDELEMMLKAMLKDLHKYEVFDDMSWEDMQDRRSK